MKGQEQKISDDIIVIENVSHLYTGHQGREVMALENISLSVKRGEFVAVIGTNGSGKSTLARHLNALLLPSEGSCRIDGMDTKEMEHLWKIRQRVGMVFQNPDNQLVTAVVEEDVAFGPENLGVPSAEIGQRVTEALQQVGMEEFRLHGPHLLSGGQKQRVAIAGVLAMQPECLVLDEPTAMLDPQGRQEVLSTVCRLNRNENITVVYITHFMEEAVAADRVVVMEQGKVVLMGTPVEIFSQAARMKELGLDVPVAADVAYRLRQKGVKLPQGIITDEGLAEVLCLSC